MCLFLLLTHEIKLPSLSTTQVINILYDFFWRNFIITCINFCFVCKRVKRSCVSMASSLSSSKVFLLIRKCAWMYINLRLSFSWVCNKNRKCILSCVSLSVRICIKRRKVNSFSLSSVHSLQRRSYAWSHWGNFCLFNTFLYVYSNVPQTNFAFNF